MSGLRSTRARRRLAGRLLTAVAAVLVTGALTVTLTGGKAPPAPEGLSGATPSSTSAPPAHGTAPVADDDAAVSACVQAVTRQVGERVGRSVDLELASTPGGWRVTVAVVSGRSFDCDVTRAGRTAVGPTPASRPGVHELLGRQHLACRAVEPGLLAVSGAAPDARQQAQAALVRALPHLAPDTVRAVVAPHEPEGPVAQLTAIYRSCLDRGWGGDAALLSP